MAWGVAGLSWQNIRIYHECDGRIEKSAQGSPFGISRLAEWWQTVIPRDRFFYPTLTRILDSFSCVSHFYLKNSFQKPLNTLRYNFTWWRHFNITMTSLDVKYVSSNITNVCSPHVTVWVRLQGLDKIFYPRVKSQIPVSGMQEIKKYSVLHQFSWF